jgi:hypothetical protein
MMNGAFTLDLSRFSRKWQTRLPDTVRKITLEAFRRIIMKTPVDTGAARGNRQVSAVSGASYDLTHRDQSGSATLTRAADGVLGWDCRGSLFMTNSLPYIGKLEYGSSRQAPQGMVRLTLAEMQAWIESIG